MIKDQLINKNKECRHQNSRIDKGYQDHYSRFFTSCYQNSEKKRET